MHYISREENVKERGFPVPLRTSLTRNVIELNIITSLNIKFINQY